MLFSVHLTLGAMFLQGAKEGKVRGREEEIFAADSSKHFRWVAGGGGGDAGKGEGRSLLELDLNEVRPA